MNFSKVFWGLLVVFVGVCLLMVNFGLMTTEALNHIWQLWPVVLVALGLSIMARGSSKIISGILGAIAFLVLIGFFAAFLHPATRAILTKETVESKKTIIAEPINEDATSAKIDISTGAADLEITGRTSQLIEGEIESNFTSVETTRSLSDQIDSFKISSRGTSIPFFHSVNNWRLSLNDQLPTELEISAGAVDANIDLSQTKVNKLVYKSGATTTDITFPENENKVEAQINVGASTVTLNVPNNVAVKITAQTGATSQNFEQFGLKKNGNIYQSDNYDGSEKKIDINLQTGASSIELNKI